MKKQLVTLMLFLPCVLLHAQVKQPLNQTKPSAPVSVVAIADSSVDVSSSTHNGPIRLGMMKVDPLLHAGKSAEQTLFDVLKLPMGYSFQAIDRAPKVDQLGQTHQRYDLYFQGIKIEGSQLIAHWNEQGFLHLINGVYSIAVPEQLSPVLMPEVALDMAVAQLGIETPMWDDPAAAAFANYEKPTGDLVIFPDLKDNDQASLAWKFDVFASGQPIRDIVYMDATNGEMLYRNPIIKHADHFGHEGQAKVIAYVPDECEVLQMETTAFNFLAPGDADTKYSGNDRPVETVQNAGTYTLISSPNGVTIRTYDANNAPANSTTGITDITDPNNDNDWEASEFPGKAQGELDAHWGAEEVYDYWDAVHGRNSFDEAGASIFSLVHVETNYNNAFWNGSWMSYGDGSCGTTEGCNGFDILTSLDVCAHEIGHAVITNTSNLVYERESGALNEGFADIWGAAVEHRSKGTGTDTDPNDEVWLIGDEIDRRAGSAALRSMEDPQSLGQPDTWRGINWYPATVGEGCITPNSNTNDNCGVHINSGVLNYWFFLLVEGGSGTNDNSDAYNVAAIGMTKAELIAARMQELYLATNADFADARVAGIQAAEDLYGACSTEVETVTDAWYAVGVGAAYVNSCTPAIGFASVSQTTSEGSGCTFTDINVTVEIAIAASANADVSFTVSGGSATEGTDFAIQTPSVTFPSGSTADQTMTIRVYHDDFVESDENATIDLSVQANGGDAIADTGADTFTLNIGNDDSAHTPSSNVSLYYEDFDDGSYDVTTGGNAGSDLWSAGNNAALTSTYWTTTGNSTIFGFTNDDSCNCDKGNDQLLTTAFSLDGPYTSASLTFDHAFADVSESGAVYIDHDNDSNFDLLMNLSNTSTAQGGGAYETPWVNNVVIDLSSYIGQPDVNIMFLYNDGGNWAYGMAVDNIAVDAVTNTSIQTAVNSGGPDTMDIHSAGSAHASDPSSGDVMVDITNNDSFDYECVNVSVSRSGTSAQAYNGSSLPYHVMDKTFSLVPTSTTGSGDVSLAFYFEEAEIAGWESATGLSRNDLYIARGNASSIDEMAAATISAFGSDVILSADMSGLNGTYYFGHLSSFAPPCAGATKTWDGSNWSPMGAPDSTNPVVIDGDYDTATHGSFDACTLTVNATRTLTIDAGDHTNVQGSIIVDGTLIVEHQGSVVQVDDDAVVTNNGTINVNTTSPNLASRDFMILGSPMSGETRTDVWNAAFLVLNHLTGNFVPNPQVALLMPGAENFADDNYDNWVAYSGAINPGEGYIVRPQAGYGQPGGVFNYTYDSGTLNNGVVNFDVIYNQPTSGVDPDEDKNASPNVVSNPYPSAISADAFIAANDMVDEIYFWEHITPPSVNIPGAGSMDFSMEDISMRNLVGGVAATNDLVTADGPTYNEYIATSQGFGFKANLEEVISNGGTINDDVVFNNSMRVNGNNDNLRNPQNKDRVWIAIGNSEHNVKRTTLIGFMEAASPGMDRGYDTRRMATMLSIYSHLQDGSKQLGIQGREPFESGMKVELGFSSLIDTNTQYKISIDHIEGPNLEGVTVYLRDAQNPAYGLHNLSEAPYTFFSEATTDHNRFTVLFEGQEELGIADGLANSIGMFPNPSAGQLTINSPLAPMETLTVFDLLGREVYQQTVGSQTSITIDLNALQPAMYFVNIRTDQGLVTKKLIRR